MKRQVFLCIISTMLMFTGCEKVADVTTTPPATATEVESVKVPISVSKAFIRRYRGEQKNKIYELGDDFLSCICNESFTNPVLISYINDMSELHKLLLSLNQTEYFKTDFMLSYDISTEPDVDYTIIAYTSDKSVRWELQVFEDNIVNIKRVSPIDYISLCKLPDIFDLSEAEVYTHEGFIDYTTDYLKNETYLLVSHKMLQSADKFIDIARTVVPEDIKLYPGIMGTVSGVSDDYKTIYRVYTSSERLGPQVEIYNSAKGFDVEMESISRQVLLQLVENNNVLSKIDGISVSISDEKAKVFEDVYSIGAFTPKARSSVGTPTGQFNYEFNVNHDKYNLQISFDLSKSGVKEAHCWVYKQ